MASSKVSSTSKSTSTVKASSEPAEFTSSDFEDILDSSTSTPTSTLSSVATRSILTISRSERPTSTPISSILLSAVPSSVPQLSTPTPTSVAPPNLFPVSSSQVSRPTLGASSSRNQNAMSPGIIAIVAASSFGLILIVVSSIVLVLRYRRRHRDLTSKGGGSRDLDSEEKYIDRSQYKSYGGSQQKEPLLDQGMAPLLNVPSINQHTRSPSLSSDLESHLYHEGPTSPFLNENERRAGSNAALNPDTTPYALTEVRDGSMDAVALLPAIQTPSNSQSRASVAASRLSPLIIPESRKTAPPSRRQSKGKNWKRASSNVDANPPPADTVYDSDDSESLYSQASASTYRTFTVAPTTRQSTIQPFPYPSFPLPSIPQSPYQGASAAASSSRLDETNGSRIGEHSKNTGYLPSPVDSLSIREEEGNGNLGKEETLFVATLLQSRLSRVPKQGLAPNRSSSIVSHIERAGSIKPALASVETAGGSSRYGPRSRSRRARDTVKSQILHGSELRNDGSDSYQN